MKNKRLAKWIALALALVQVLLPLQTALADEVPEGSIEITNAVFDLTTKDGASISPGDPIPQDAKIEIRFDYKLNNAKDIKPGDTFSVQLTSSGDLSSIINFVDPATLDKHELRINWESHDYLLGILTIAPDGTATITFQDDVRYLSDVTGSFWLNGNFNPEAITGDEPVTFTLTAGGETTINFEPDPVIPPDPSASIEKEGSYNPETNEIIWTITVDSGSPTATATDLTVRDELDTTYQTYKSCSLGSGKVIAPNLPDVPYYTFYLGDVIGRTSFEIKTTPTADAFGTEGSKRQIDNTATLHQNGEDEPLSTGNANVTITTNWVEKEGAYAYVEADGNHYITWTITVNNNHLGIPAGSTVTDTIPHHGTFLQFVTGSIQLNGGTPPAGDTYGVADSLLTYTFTAGTAAAAGPQVITFKTEVLEDYFDQQAVRSFTNTAMLLIPAGDYAGSYSATAGEDVGVPVSTSLLTKEGKGYDRATQLISWEMKANGNGKEITGAMIVDELGADQIFYDYAAVDGETSGPTGGVYRDGGRMMGVSDAADVTSAPNQYYYNVAAKTLTIYLGDLSASNKPTITFKTKVTNAADYANNLATAKPYSNNKARLTGGGIQPSEVTNTHQNVSSTVLAKTAGDYDYAAREIEWTVTVNQNKMHMPNAVITDTIAVDQQYVTGSLRIGAETAEPSSPRLIVSGDKRTLTINLGAIDGEVTIRFKTVITDPSKFLATNGNVKFRNDASLTSGIPGAPDVSVYVEKEIPNQPIKKDLLREYTRTNGNIGWEVFINPHQILLTNATLKDTLQAGLELDIDSVKLYKWNQEADGSMTAGDLVPANEYSFTYDYGTREFVIHLPNGAQGYYLTFDTDVLATTSENGGKYKNTIQFEGSYTGSDTVSSSHLVTNADIGAQATGRNGKITVTKKDKGTSEIITDHETVFELLDSLMNVQQTKSTINGQVTFDKLKLDRTYYIREKTPPLGYGLNYDAAGDPVIEAPITLGGTVTQASIVVSNSLLTGTVKIRKDSTSGKLLNGGSFGIYAGTSAIGTPVMTAAVVNGIVTFSGEGLLPGTYTIAEITPPPNHKKTDKTVTVTLALDDDPQSATYNTIPEINLTADEILDPDGQGGSMIPNPDIFINEANPGGGGGGGGYYYGSIRVNKVDGKNRPLAGAQFGLFTVNGALWKTAVTDAYGVVVFSGLPSGSYVVREIAAPVGYILSQAPLTVSVGGGQAGPYIFVNQANVLPRTGSFWDTTVLYTLGGLLVLAGAAILLWPKLKKKKNGDTYES